MFNLAIAFSIGVTAGVVLVRYGIGLGTKIVQRTQDGLPAFGRDEPPITQTHTGIDAPEEEEEEDER